ncbi:hypothetical protein C0995_000699 [Termitomyces sp. Mi166|nr:hypothetical protein C0995_000699 [Termitomyces sp. Mi166\
MAMTAANNAVQQAADAAGALNNAQQACKLQEAAVAAINLAEVAKLAADKALTLTNKGATADAASHALEASYGAALSLLEAGHLQTVEAGEAAILALDNATAAQKALEAMMKDSEVKIELPWNDEAEEGAIVDNEDFDGTFNTLTGRNRCFLPDLDKMHKALKDIKLLIKPPQDAGAGYKDLHLNLLF